MQTHTAPSKSASHASKPFFGSQPARSTNFFAASPVIQTKLTVGESGDRFELEADAVADRVVQRMDAGRIARATTPAVQTACAACAGKDDMLQRQAEPGEQEMLQAKGPDVPASVPAAVEQNLRVGRAGHSLAPQLQAQMEQAFQADFSSVRVHTGASAEHLNQELHARAFTHGNDIYFNAGEFQPDSRAGQHLLAHELTHFVQQSSSAGSVPSVQRDDPKPGLPADKLQTAKNELKARFGLKDVSEQSGAAWTESQLKKMAGLFSKMSTEEQERLQGVTLVLTDKFPSKKLKGKTFNIAGTTYGTFRVELTPTGVSDTAIHEAGHLIHNNAIANAEKLFERSQIKADLETARNFSTRAASGDSRYPQTNLKSASRSRQSSMRLPLSSAVATMIGRRIEKPSTRLRFSFPPWGQILLRRTWQRTSTSYEPLPTKIPSLHQHAPVLEELLLEAGQTFLPAIEGGVNVIDVLLPPPRVP